VNDCGQWDYRDWRETQRAEGPDGETEAVRQATRTGEPLGSREFVQRLERWAGTRLGVLARGRTKRKFGAPEDAADQGCLFAGREE